MNSKEIEVLKDKYAMNTLSPTERASLEVAMLNDPDLERELTTHNNIVKGVQYAGKLELQDMLDKIHYQQNEEGPIKARSNLKLYILAGLILLIGIAAYFLISNKAKEEVNPNKIYAQFYTQYQPSLQDRGASIDEAITSFNQSYANGDFQEAVNSIKPFLSESDNGIKLTAAIAANEINDLVLAEKLFDEIIESNDYYFVDHAIWYKALIKLKTGATKSIKDILTPLIDNPKADHHNEAIKLVAELNG